MGRPLSGKEDGRRIRRVSGGRDVADSAPWRDRVLLVSWWSCSWSWWWRLSAIALKVVMGW